MRSGKFFSAPALDFGAWPNTRRKLAIAGFLVIGACVIFAFRNISLSSDLSFRLSADVPAVAGATSRGVEDASTRIAVESELYSVAMRQKPSYSSVLQCIHSAINADVLLRDMMIDLHAGTVDLFLELNDSSVAVPVLSLLNSNDCLGAWFLRSLATEFHGAGIVVMEVRGNI
jgi:hypothetical protein